MRTATKYTHRCYIPSFWYRAEILSLNGPNATVIFVDFGNEKTLPLENIFELRSQQLAKLPKLVVKCKLDGLEAIEHEELSNAAKQYFDSLIGVKEFHLTVNCLSQEDDLYKVTLTNSSGDSIAEKLTKLQEHQVEFVSNATHEHLLNYIK